MKIIFSDLIVGIAVRNEEKTIYETLTSLTNEIHFFPKLIKIKIIVVLNGCVDNTIGEVQRYQANQREQNRLKIAIEKIADEGLVPARQRIWYHKKENDCIIFLDADIVLKSGSLYAFYRRINNPDTKIVWANVTPIYKPETKLLSLTRILNFRDYYPQVFEIRKYLFGRVFSTREYGLHIEGDDKMLKTNSKLSKLLSLNKGPIVDDIYLTKYFYLKYGIESIKNFTSVVGYYNPITSLVDFYFSQRRTIIEMYRLELLYPTKEATYKNMSYLKKTINPLIYYQLSFINKVECVLYILLYNLCRKISKIELFVKIVLVRCGIPLTPIGIWPSIKSSKIKFRRFID